jgi:hypothetical protein
LAACNDRLGSNLRVQNGNAALQTVLFFVQTHGPNTLSKSIGSKIWRAKEDEDENWVVKLIT